MDWNDFKLKPGELSVICARPSQYQKTDFGFAGYTNTSATMPKAAPTMAEMLEAVEYIRENLVPPGDRPDHFAAADGGLAYLQKLKDMSGSYVVSDPKAGMNAFCGIKIITDPSLPADVLELRNSEGAVLQRFRL